MLCAVWQMAPRYTIELDWLRLLCDIAILCMKSEWHLSDAFSMYCIQQCDACTAHATMMRMIAMQRAKWMNGKCERVNLMWRTVARKNASGIFIQWQSCGWQTDCHCLTHFAISRTHSFIRQFIVWNYYLFSLVCCSQPRNTSTVWPTIKWFFCYMNRNNFATI